MSPHFIGRNGNQIQPIRAAHPNIDIRVEKAQDHEVQGEWVIVLRGTNEEEMRIVEGELEHEMVLKEIKVSAINKAKSPKKDKV